MRRIADWFSAATREQLAAIASELAALRHERADAATQEQLAGIASELAALRRERAVAVTQERLAGMASELVALRRELVALQEVSAAGREALASTLAATRGGISTLQGESGEALSHVVALSRRLVGSEEDLALTKAGVSATQQQVGEVASEVAALRRELSAVQEDGAAGRETLAGALAAMRGGLSALQGESGETLSHVIALSRRLVGSEEDVALTRAGMSATQHQVGEIASEIAALRREVAAQQEASAADREALAGALAAMRGGLSALQGEGGETLSQVVALSQRLVDSERDLVLTKAGVSALQQQTGDIASEAAALRRELAALKEGEVDYQLLMTQQEKLAELKDLDPQFLAFYQACRRFTMTSVERLYSLYKSVEYITLAAVPGDLAECGVWRGGSCMLMALQLVAHRDTERDIYLFDTYEGHPKPDPERDSDLWGNRGIDEWTRRTAAGTGERWGAASLTEVRNNLISAGYPTDRLKFIKGLVEDTVPAHQPEKLALLRLDTDWYESTRVALRHLYPKLAEGGVLVIDDYGHYQGQRRAVDEYFAEIGEHPLLHRVDYSCRVMVKRSR